MAELNGTHAGSRLGIRPTGRPVTLTGVNVERTYIIETVKSMITEQPAGDHMREEEKPIIGLYRLESGGYFVQDDYRLVKDKKRQTGVLLVKTGTHQLYPELVDASFRLNKIFTFSNERGNNVELAKSYVEGRFSTVLNPDERIEPLRYTKGSPTAGELYALYSRYELTTLSGLTQPIIGIKGRFAHAEHGTERCYDIEIRNAILTQDLPGAFFVMPVAESVYNFVATDASFERVLYDEETRGQR